MSTIFSFILDIILIALLIAGIVYAMRLSKQLAGLRASRAEMERFVVEFSTTVQRAESGIRGLKLAARTGGDDLEKQIEKAHLLRDELQFLVESADQIATRLSETATIATRTTAPEQQSQPMASVTVLSQPKQAPENKPASVKSLSASAEKKVPHVKGAQSAAENELLKALEKLG